MAKKKKNLTLKIISIFALMFTTSTTSVFLGYFVGAENRKVVEEVKVDADVEKFYGVYKDILDNYYEEVDKEVLIKGAITGMLESLGDEYSSYLNEDENDEFQLQVNGSYEGIGVALNNTEDGKIVISSIFADSPADKAGIKAMDIIKKIDNIDFTTKKSTDVVDYVRKSDRKSFIIVIERDGKEIEIPITRSKVTIKSVNSRIIENGNKKIGYIHVNVFAANTRDQFKVALDELEKSNIDGMIIDLRNNTGGYLSIVNSMTSLFLDDSKIIYQTEVKGKVEVFKSTGNVTKKYKVVMLGNEISASASEIMIAAMVESYGAQFVGMPTYGKGTVQELNNFSDSDAFKFTIKKWLTPKGNWINEVGIKPTVEVKQNDEFYKTGKDSDDSQLQKALELLK